VAWRVRWTEPAWDGVERQAAYIALDSPRYAAALVRDARDAARSLRQYPKRGRVVPEENNPDIRELFVFNNYRMLYQIFDHEHEVHIIAFVHGAQLLENAFAENE
jgi:plasmid stabilization system protein ParE